CHPERSRTIRDLRSRRIPCSGAEAQALQGVSSRGAARTWPAERTPCKAGYGDGKYRVLRFAQDDSACLDNRASLDDKAFPAESGSAVQGNNPYSVTPIGVPTNTLPFTISGVTNLPTGV